MKARNGLRLTIACYWIFMVLSLVASVVLESSLPPLLVEWLEQQAEMDVKTSEIILLCILLPVILVELAGSIGLFLLKSWAKWAFLISLVVSYLFYPFLGPTVEHAWADTLDELSVVLSGVIVGIAFFTDALKNEAEQEPSPSPAGEET